METFLTLGGGQLPPFSARGCTQTLTPLPMGELRRTVNGNLIHIGAEKHFKYKSVIACQDKAGPCLDGLWRGQEVEVGCLSRLHQEMKQEGDHARATLLRPPVEGSVAVQGTSGTMVSSELSGRDVQAPLAQGETLFVSYAPRLHMRVISFEIKTDEWGARVGWRLELEEI